MPITSDFRDWDVQWLTSKDKEATYGVALTTSLSGANGRSGLFKGPDFAERTPEIITDEEQAGRLTDFSKSQVIHSWDSKISRTWDASIFWTAWCFAFAMGTDAVVGSSPNVTHTAKFMDENVAGSQLPAASIIEKIAGVTTLQQRKYAGMCVSEVTISAQGKQRLQLAASLVGSGRAVTDATAIPTGVVEEYLRGSNVDFTLNAINLKDYVKGWSIKVSNNPLLDDGYVLGASGDLGLYRERIFFGKRMVEVALTVLAPPTATIDIQTLMENQTNAPIVITAVGDSTAHSAKFTVSNFKLNAVPKGSDNNQIIYNISGTAQYNAADTGPLKVECILDEAGAFLSNGT